MAGFIFAFLTAVVAFNLERFSEASSSGEIARLRVFTGVEGTLLEIVGTDEITIRKSLPTGQLELAWISLNFSAIPSLVKLRDLQRLDQVIIRGSDKLPVPLHPQDFMFDCGVVLQRISNIFGLDVAHTWRLNIPKQTGEYLVSMKAGEPVIEYLGEQTH